MVSGVLLGVIHKKVLSANFTVSSVGYSLQLLLRYCSCLQQVSPKSVPFLFLFPRANTISSALIYSPVNKTLEFSIVGAFHFKVMRCEWLCGDGTYKLHISYVIGIVFLLNCFLSLISVKYISIFSTYFAIYINKIELYLCYYHYLSLRNPRFR